MKKRLLSLVGNHVDVVRKPDDMFNHDFTGFATGIRNGNLQVTDADGDVWEVDADQCSISGT